MLKEYEEVEEPRMDYRSYLVALFVAARLESNPPALVQKELPEILDLADAAIIKLSPIDN